MLVLSSNSGQSNRAVGAWKARSSVSAFTKSVQGCFESLPYCADFVSLTSSFPFYAAELANQFNGTVVRYRQLREHVLAQSIIERR